MELKDGRAVVEMDIQEKYKPIYRDATILLRPKTGLTDAVLKLAGGGQNLRVIVDFPAGYTPPSRGSTVTRDEARPYEITEVRKQSDGQLNVFVREIMQ